MRRLQNLAKRPTEVVKAHEFRNLNEILEFLEGLDRETHEADEVLRKYEASVQECADYRTCMDWHFTTANVPVPGIRKLEVRAAGLRKISIVGPDSKRLKVPVGEVPQLKKSVKGLDNNLAVVQKYLEQLDMLNSAQVQAQTAFSGSRNLASVLKKFEERRKHIQKMIGEAQDFIQKTAHHNLPPEVKKTFGFLTKKLVSLLHGRYKKSTELLQVNAIQDPKWGPVYQFTKYLRLQDLVNNRGFVYHEFYIIMVCGIDPRGVHHYFIDTSTTFVPPSTRMLNDHVRGFPFYDPKKGLRLLETHLKAEEALDVFAAIDSPLDEKDLHSLQEAFKDKIDSVVYDEKTKDTKIVLSLDVDEKDAPKVLEQILGHLSTVLRGRMNNKVRYKEGKMQSGRKLYKIYFSVPEPTSSQQYKDDVHTIQRLKEELNLGDQDVREVTRVLRSRLQLSDQDHDTTEDTEHEGK